MLNLHRVERSYVVGENWREIGISLETTGRMATLPLLWLFKKSLNASKPSEHPPSGEKMSKGLGGNVGCRDKTSSWYQTGSPM